MTNKRMAKSLRTAIWNQWAVSGDAKSARGLAQSKTLTRPAKPDWQEVNAARGDRPRTGTLRQRTVSRCFHIGRSDSKRVGGLAGDGHGQSDRIQPNPTTLPRSVPGWHELGRPYGWPSNGKLNRIKPNQGYQGEISYKNFENDLLLAREAGGGNPGLWDLMGHNGS